MPLVAQTANKTRVNILDYKNPKEEITEDVYSLQTNEKMIIVTPRFKTNHFRHPAGTSYGGGGESDEHLATKAEIYFKLQEKYSNTDKLVQCEVEIEIPQTEGRKRIIDVAVLNPDGTVKEAYEVQLSRITFSEIKTRNNDYQKYGVEDIYWILGDKNYGIQEIVEYLYHQNGTYAKVDIQYDEVETELF